MSKLPLSGSCGNVNGGYHMMSGSFPATGEAETQNYKKVNGLHKQNLQTN